MASRGRASTSARSPERAAGAAFPTAVRRRATPKYASSDTIPPFARTERVASDLKDSLASLKIERDKPARRSWRWPVLLLVPAVLLLGVLYALRARQALSVPQVATATAEVSAGGGAAPPGAAMLTASGYVVARRKAVVSAKIQGRLAELRVEEGSRVKSGELIARLESTDYEAARLRAQAAIGRAEADLEESRRQSALADRLASDKVV